MKVLLINPNVTEAVTANMLAEARANAAEGIHIQGVTARFGTAYVENRVEAAIAGHAVLDAIAEHGEDTQGVIVAAFGDPGLAAAREFCDVPVVGISESALLAAWMLGRRIAIVCMTQRLATWYRECARDHDLDARLVVVRALDGLDIDLANARRTLRQPIKDLCQRCIDEDAAEVVIVGGGPLAGLAADLAPEIPVPLLDGVPCAVAMLEAIMKQRPRPARRGSFARPAAKSTRGLSTALSRRIEGD